MLIVFADTYGARLLLNCSNMWLNAALIAIIFPSFDIVSFFRSTVQLQKAIYLVSFIY